MSDPMVRLIVALGVVALALGVAYVASKIRRPIHPDIVVGDVGDRPGVVMFTSTDCSTCKQAIGRLKTAQVPFREVTHELEPARFEEWEVLAVPLTVFLNESSEAVAVLTGVPTKRAIGRAAARAGIDAG
jgi:hypothetical protein